MLYLRQCDAAKAGFDLTEALWGIHQRERKGVRVRTPIRYPLFGLVPSNECNHVTFTTSFPTQDYKPHHSSSGIGISKVAQHLPLTLSILTPFLVLPRSSLHSPGPRSSPPDDACDFPHLLQTPSSCGPIPAQLQDCHVVLSTLKSALHIPTYRARKVR